MFNTFLRDFKDSFSSKGRADFWDEVVTQNIGLISKLESEQSNVSKKDADGFLKKAEIKEEEEPAPNDDDVDDLVWQYCMQVGDGNWM